jgi:phosphoglycolate phosphatase
LKETAVTQAIIFDLDGTLIDSCGVCVAILEGMIAERDCQVRIDPLFARSFMSRGGEAMVAALLGDACRDPAADLAEFRERYRFTQTPVSALYTGVKQGLQYLHGLGIRLAICSNKPQVLCEKVLVDTGIAGLFCIMVGGVPDLRPKPAPDLMDKTLAGLGLSAQHCAYVGDSEVDHAVARSADMPFYFLTHGYADPDWRANDCPSFDAFPELVACLAGQAQRVMA